MKRTPFRVDTYCGQCHDNKPHYLRAEHCDEKRECFECSACLHLVFVPRGKSESVGVAWYETRKEKS
jgi:hypothetical protein